MITGLIDRDLSEKAVISCDAILGEAVELMDSIGYGMLVSLDQNRVVKGVFTDGDFRRSVRLNNKPIAALMTDNLMAHSSVEPLVVFADDTFGEVCGRLSHRLYDLVVIDRESREYLGLISSFSIFSYLLDQ